MRHQRPIKNRKKLYSGVLPQIERRVEELAFQHDCGKSFVVNTLLADKLKIVIEERFDDYRKADRKAKRTA